MPTMCAHYTTRVRQVWVSCRAMRDTRPVSIRLTAQEQQLVRQAAQANGVSLSAFIRHAAVAAAITLRATLDDPALEYVRLAIDPARLADVQRALAEQASS